MDWDEHNKQKKTEAAERRNEAAEDYAKASNLAANHLMDLTQHTDQHYQLKWTDDDGRRILNIYPGNCRLYYDKKYMRPYLKVASPWTLLEVVEAAIKTLKRN